MLSRLKRFAFRGVGRLLSAAGYSLVATSAPKPEDTMEGAIRGLARRGHAFVGVIDVGASNGSWSLLCMKHFPAARYLLIEAQPVHERALAEFVTRHRNATFTLAAAGEATGRIYFDATDPLGGQASLTPYRENNIEVPVTTVDAEIRAKGLRGPYLLKLDTHGFEVPILRGAATALGEVDAIIIECYNFNLTPESPLFHEMCDYLKHLGFRCIDLVDALHRQRDGALWQMDLVFVRDTRPEFRHNEYL